jgi:hypothetical protein
MFVSDYFELDEKQVQKMSSMGVLDALLDKDSHFFINIIRLKESSTPEFIEAYQHINKFFSDIATLLDAADNPTMDDKLYRTARSMFCFNEVNGIKLGFSNSDFGSGWGDKLSDKVLFDAYQIVKKGSKHPELFHLVSLFEEGIGPDRLSDMIATIIEPQIICYTLRILNELGISQETRPDLCFLENGLVQNPKNEEGILLLPEEILHELPIARTWDDISRVAYENEAIRKEISAEVGAEWTRWASPDRKRYLRERIFMEPEACSRVIDCYRQQELAAYDPKEDLNYLVEVLLKEIKQTELFNCKIKHPNSLVGTHAIIEIFKDWVENNRGWALIQDAPSKNREKAVQRMIHLAAKYYVETNDLDFSCEPDEGRGPVDVKLSRGSDKTLAEIKLSTNGQYLHGYESQIREYGNAERTRNLIYVFVDLGNPSRKKKLIALNHKIKYSTKDCPELVIVDARSKNAASTFDESWEFSFEDIPEINLDDFPDLNTDELDWQV